MEKWKVIRTIEETGIIAIVRGTKPQEMMRIASALYNGGVKVIEVTCNTPGYLGMIEQLAGEMGEKMIIGAGTVLNAPTAQSVIDAGATFALAPDLNPEVIKALHEKNRLIIPGVATPTEMVQAQRLGVDLMKLFPAGALGARFLKEVRGPLADIRFIPVGGINLTNIGEFAEAGAVAFGIGGELVNKSVIDSGSYDQLTKRAEDFIEAVRRHRH
ncbi:bifunctional 4-hydroxy-2-oxoglutarate aldolase/2-dehydro-3-deoxy-phosphogluconate aldolase [Paenibacillus sp. URB8-2]|uniref:bifunctional 4-hydroxy-2-oxoglutarate aldolase/2-dehydro-3-deoxy-phosphogluconate aldolase n=1 Tax=Paenibacillus sp. URB8-2 TaxID=2741301 RepID=UPI0015BEE626|nr:bifunctional 4-hydroxy-2-oxoglutarate aldolase/2-dehydro-3-deoxy-phosphogluconate aldolase [Paenibacillus sp. URB8-2]BCG61586.1 bifunctional 2-keto-4-hydroxyglutarate aldolase/2-keto-3-deoxy-6-phosphogluconate aldolase [Paenibacillus sp. URB8-2]